MSLTQALYLTTTKPRFIGEPAADFFARSCLAVDRLTDEKFGSLCAKTREGVNAAVKAANAGKSTEPKRSKDE